MRILLFGATGTAGSGVLRACLKHPAVADLRVVSRRPLSIGDHRVRTIVHEDYLDYDRIEAAFSGVDACLWCLGISVQQVSGEPEYRRITHDFPMAAAHELRRTSPTAVFHYLSGDRAGLDSRFMWARVKAETERDLAAVMSTVCWRPGFIDGGAEQRGPALYRAMGPLIRPFRFIRSIYVASEDIGWAMLQAVTDNRRSGILDNRQIRDMADRARPVAAQQAKAQVIQR